LPIKIIDCKINEQNAKSKEGTSEKTENTFCKLTSLNTTLTFLTVINEGVLPCWDVTAQKGSCYHLEKLPPLYKRSATSIIQHWFSSGLKISSKRKEFLTNKYRCINRNM